MERTLQELKVEKLLFDLIKVGQKRLRVVFSTRRETCKRMSDSRQESIAVKDRDYVTLYLVGEDGNVNLNQWVDAIIHAEALLGLLEKEYLHEINHPDFSTAMRAKYDFMTGNLKTDIDQ